MYCWYGDWDRPEFKSELSLAELPAAIRTGTYLQFVVFCPCSYFRINNKHEMNGWKASNKSGYRWINCYWIVLCCRYFFEFKYFLLQIFHGVWTIAFFVLTLVNAKTVLPNASCLLAGYLPATTVLHILLIPSDYPLPVSSNIFHLSRYFCLNIFQTPRLLCCNHRQWNCEQLIGVFSNTRKKSWKMG